MGLLLTDLTPINSSGPTTNVPSAKDVQTKVFQVARTDTVASIKSWLPADASLLSIQLCGSVASNAGTTAAVTLTVANNSGTISTGTVDVKTSGASTLLAQMTNLPNIQPIPLTGDISITAVYAETGTVSTLGGPWVFVVEYVR